MKIHFRHLFIALAGLAIAMLNSRFSSALAQGSLTPPGAPAPTMKSLDQVEARTIVNAANTPGDANNLFNISKPGSYYLTTNLTGVSGKNGIEITTNNVTLDLNGFAVQDVSGSSNGIWIPNASTNITVRNGALSGWGFDGVSNTSASAVNIVCERLNVSANNDDGISLSSSGVVRDCNSQKNNRIGIDCFYGGNVLISGCNASANAIDGFLVGNNCTVNDCVASSNGVSGITAGTNCIINTCNACGNQGGIATPDDCIVIGCTASGNTALGMFVKSNCTIKDCIVSANGGDGLQVYGNNCQITGNTCSGNLTYGIEIIGIQDRVDNNSVGNNTSFGIFPDNINVTNSITRNSSPGPGYGNTAGNNNYAPIGTPNTATSPWANFH